MYINHRLLKYKLESFDYTKINNSHYVNRKKKQLLLNYYWNLTKNIKNTILYAHKISKPSWYRIITDLGLMNEICDTYKLNTVNKDIIWNTINNRCCLECNKIISPHKTFCSNQCSNTYKSKDSKFKNKLKESIKQSYLKMSNTKLNAKYKKISDSIKKTNSELTNEERSIKYRNKKQRLTAFDNLHDRFSEITFLFDKEFFYNNKHLPVKCKKCGHSWNMTKTTNISCTICRKCNPYQKHKTQTEIYKYILSHTHANQNVKYIISNELDIYIKDFNFAIEFDGLLPHSYGQSKVSYYNNFDINSHYHVNKTNECEDKGIHLFHIFENEFFDKQKQKIWFSMIDNKLGLSKSVYARNCVIKEINHKIAKQFMDDNHLQGHTQSAIKIGLYHGDELLSVMTFRKHKKFEWEIARFATKCGYTVVGGAGKLLKYFERTYAPKTLLSYANRRWSQGNVYEKLGFTFDGFTPPNHFYFKENENILFKREKFQKHKLQSLLNTYDESISGIRNMMNNNYRIIFDCGNKKYVKYYK